MAYWYGCGAKTFHLPGLRRTLTCQVRLVFEEFDQKLGLGSGPCGPHESEVSHFLVPNGSKWHSEGSRAQKCLNFWNKCLNWLLAIRTDHYEPFSAQEKVKFGVQKVLKWPKLAKNGTVGALEPRKAGTSWNKCWNRLLTIRTDHHKPFTAQEKAKFCVQKVPKWPLLAKNGPK